MAPQKLVERGYHQEDIPPAPLGNKTPPGNGGGDAVQFLLDHPRDLFRKDHVVFIGDPDRADIGVDGGDDIVLVGTSHINHVPGIRGKDFAQLPKDIVFVHTQVAGKETAVETIAHGELVGEEFLLIGPEIGNHHEGVFLLQRREQFHGPGNPAYLPGVVVHEGTELLDDFLFQRRPGILQAQQHGRRLRRGDIFKESFQKAGRLRLGNQQAPFLLFRGDLLARNILVKYGDSRILRTEDQGFPQVKNYNFLFFINHLSTSSPAYCRPLNLFLRNSWFCRSASVMVFSSVPSMETIIRLYSTSIFSSRGSAERI